MRLGALVCRSVAVAALATVLCSCGSDDEGSNGANGGGSSIVGSWNLVSWSSGGQTVTAQQMGTSMVVTINAKGTYTAVTTEDGVTETENGTWSVSGNFVSFSAEGAPQNALYSVNGNVFVLTYTEDGVSVTLSFSRL